MLRSEIKRSWNFSRISRCLLGCVVGCVASKPQSININSFYLKFFQCWLQNVGDHMLITFTIHSNSIVTIALKKEGLLMTPPAHKLLHHTVILCGHIWFDSFKLFFWEYVKLQIYENKPRTIVEFETEFRRVIGKINGGGTSVVEWSSISTSG